MNRKRLHIALLVSGLLLLYACDATIHEYPKPLTSHITIELNADRRAPLYYKEIVCGANGLQEENLLAEERADPYSPDERLALRFVIEVYQGKHIDMRSPQPERLIIRREKIIPNDMQPPQDTLLLELPEGDYSALSWADYVPAENPSDWHYKTDILSDVNVVEGHTPRVNHHKSAATGYTDFSVKYDANGQEQIIINNYSHPQLAQEVPDKQFIAVHTDRPLGRYKIYATDIDEFLEAGGSLDDIQVQITYRQYISNGYNVATQQPNSFIQASSFVMRPQISVTRSGETDSPIAYDYVLVSSNNEDHVMADVTIYDKDGNEINHYQGIDIPLQRNKETVVRGPFLTLEHGSGGIGIDDNFEGEHVVEVNY